MAMKFEGRDRAFSSTLNEGERVVNASASHFKRNATTIEEPVLVKQSGWTLMILTWLFPAMLGLGFSRLAWAFDPGSMLWGWLLLAGHATGTMIAIVQFSRGKFSFLLGLDDEKITVETGGEKTVIAWDDLRKTELIETIRIVKEQEVPYHTLRLVTADKTTLDVRLNFGKSTLEKVDEAFEAKGFDVTDCAKTTARNNTTLAWLPALVGIPCYLGVSGLIAWSLLLS